MKRQPQLRLTNQQKKVSLRLRFLEEKLQHALRLLLKKGCKFPEEIEVILVSRSAIARLHKEFFNDPSATDVITFQHGDIVVCPEIAQKQRIVFKQSLHRETALYGIHGLLHIAGWDDQTEAGFQEMKQTQERLLDQVFKASPETRSGKR